MRLFRKGQRGTKLFYATDVHGSERTWKKFLKADYAFKEIPPE